MPKFLVCYRCEVSQSSSEFGYRIRDGVKKFHLVCLSCREQGAPETKKCSRCQEVKSCLEFGRNRNNQDCLQAYCKSCASAYYKSVTKQKESYQTKSKEYREARRETKANYDKQRYEAHPELKDLNRQRSNERYQNIKNDPDYIAASRQRAARYKENNPEKLKETKAAWKKRNPQQAVKDYHKRRALLQGVPSDKDLSIPTLRARDGDTCFYCGCVLDFNSYSRSLGERPSANLATHEHLIPISRGGHNTFWNSTLACLSCNTSKTDKTVEEFITWRKENL